jgi:hypothetical protein
MKKPNGLRAWPEDLTLTDEMKMYAYNKNIEPLEEFEAWKDSCLANNYQYKDWSAAWRTRIRFAALYGRQKAIVRPIAPKLTGVAPVDPEVLNQTPEQRKANLQLLKNLSQNLGRRIG